MMCPLLATHRKFIYVLVLLDAEGCCGSHKDPFLGNGFAITLNGCCGVMSVASILPNVLSSRNCLFDQMYGSANFSIELLEVAEI
jgi:hypothetical protein